LTLARTASSVLSSHTMAPRTRLLKNLAQTTMDRFLSRWFLSTKATSANQNRAFSNVTVTLQCYI